MNSELRFTRLSTEELSLLDAARDLVLKLENLADTRNEHARGMTEDETLYGVETGIRAALSDLDLARVPFGY